MFVLNGNSEKMLEAFRTFGLCEYESRIYFALQVCGKTKVANLWQRAGVPQSKIYYVIQRLVVKRLVEITKLNPLEVKAKPFLRFANDFLQDRKCLLKEISDMIGEYREVMKSNSRFVEVIT